MARIPQESAVPKDIIGLPRVADLFEARRTKSRHLAEINGIVFLR